MTPRSTALRLDGLLDRLAGARVLILFAFHAVAFAACYAFSYLVRFEFHIPPEYIATFRHSVFTVVGVQLACGALFSFYRGWWRYVGIADVVRLVIGVTTATGTLLLLWYLAPILGLSELYFRSPRGVLVIDGSFALLVLFGARVMIRLGKQNLRQPEDPADFRRVLIVGAGDSGETLARELEHRPQARMRVVGFVDDQRAKWGSLIRGIKVHGPISSIQRIAAEVKADEVLIAVPSASGKRLREIIQHLSDADLSFKTMPSIEQLVTGKVHVTQLRPVDVEDLLRRDRIDLPGDPVRLLFKGRRVMVTGAGGTIGAELASQVLGFRPAHVALVERSEFHLYEVRKRLLRENASSEKLITCNLADVSDESAMKALLDRERPEIVLHAAAHKHVPLGEDNPAEYVRNNALATRRLAELCIARGIERFVLISSDKAINPTSVMGASKRAAEILLLDVTRDSSMKVTIVRFGNVIGSSGSVIPLFMEQIAAGGPVTVTHPDVTRYFIRTSEAISLVLQAATLGDKGRVFMLDMGEPIKIVDLARDLIRLAHHSESEIQISFSGLRPGEKLFEEIRLTGESVHPTVHPQIVVTEPPQPDPAVIASWLNDLGGERRDGDRTRDALRELIPEYRSAADVVSAQHAVLATAGEPMIPIAAHPVRDRAQGPTDEVIPVVPTRERV